MSCGESVKEPNKRKLAEQTYKDAIFYTQGSTAFQNGIAEAVAIDPSYEPGIYELSVADLKRGLPHKWLPQYNKAVALDPEQRVPWRGYLYLWFYRDYHKAIADFNTSDTLTTYLDYPQGHSVDFWRGIAYLGLEDYKNSIAFWDKHITKETEDTGEDWVELEAFLYRGIAYYESGNNKKALENFDTMLTYFNQSADANYYKARIFMKKGKRSEALQLLDTALTDFDAGFYNNRSYVETLRQLYRTDITDLKDSLTN